MTDLTQERLKHLLDYNPETGVFVWKISPCSPIPKGTHAGRTKWKGRYNDIQIDGRMYRAHRLAWLYVHGVWPPLLDHIDRNPLNNAIANLRLATKSQNGANRKVHRNSKTGIKGVTPAKNSKFVAQIIYKGEHIHLGSFETKEEASQVYRNKAKELFGEFAG